VRMRAGVAPAPHLIDIDNYGCIDHACSFSTFEQFHRRLGADTRRCVWC